MVRKFGPEEQVALGLPDDRCFARVRIEEAAEWWDCELRKSVTAEGSENHSLRLPEVGMRAAGTNAGESTQASSGEVIGIRSLRCCRCLWVE